MSGCAFCGGSLAHDLGASKRHSRVYFRCVVCHVAQTPAGPGDVEALGGDAESTKAGF